MGFSWLLFLRGLMLTQLVNCYLNKEISENTKKQEYFVKAQKFGEHFHEFAENLIKKLRYKTFDPEIYLKDIAKKTKNTELLNVYHHFLNWIVDEMVNFEFMLAEKKICGVLKTNIDSQLLICGTFDALDVKKRILFEWKTTSTTKEFESWKLQTRIYNHILDYKIKKIVIYNPKINFYHEFEPKKLSQLEIISLIDAGLKLIKHE